MRRWSTSSHTWRAPDASCVMPADCRNAARTRSRTLMRPGAFHIGLWSARGGLAEPVRESLTWQVAGLVERTTCAGLGAPLSCLFGGLTTGSGPASLLVRRKVRRHKRNIMSALTDL